MKIVIHSLGELRELAEMIHAANYGRSVTAASVGAELQNRLDESDGSPERDVTAEATAGTALKWAINASEQVTDGTGTTTSFRPADYLDSPETASHYVAEAVRADSPEHLSAALVDAAESGQLDAAGVAWDAAVHSPSKALNKDGTWRAKRGLSKADAAPAPAPAPAPASAAAEAVEAAAGDTVDFSGLLAAAEAASGDQSDNLIALLDASKAFIGTHSTRAFNALKAAATADEHGVGKPIPQLTPAERRTLMAALELYDEHVA